MVEHKQYITGALGSRAFSESFGDPYELPAATAYGETCAAIGSVFWNWRMLLATGESRYADQLEWTLFNAVLCGVGLDGTSFFYENPLSSRGERAREPWFSCACCPPNLMRLLASLPHYFATGDERGVQVHQFASGTMTHGDIVLDTRTGYPWSETVTVEVRAAPQQEWELALRLPAWCQDPTVSLNGEPIEPERRSGYATMRRHWVTGDVVELDSADVRTVHGRPSAHRSNALGGRDRARAHGVLHRGVRSASRCHGHDHHHRSQRCAAERLAP